MLAKLMKRIAKHERMRVLFTSNELDSLLPLCGNSGVGLKYVCNPG